MPRGASAEGAKKVVSLRFSPEHLELVDQAAKARGWTRQAWMDRLVLRGLQGEGLLPVAPKSEPARSGEIEPNFKQGAKT